MKLTGVFILAVLLLGLLPATAWADKGRGRWDADWGGFQTKAAAQGFALRLASGRASGGQSDPNVSVLRPAGGTQQAVVCAKTPSPPWVGPFSGSNWISTQGDCTQNVAPGDYTYTTTFTLPSNPSQLRIRGSVLADNSVKIRLNGSEIFSGGDYTRRSAFASDNSGLFVAGVSNTLTFVVSNAGTGDNPTGLDFVASVSSGAPSVWKNHGQCVSAFVHSLERGHGRGWEVREAAHDCRGDWEEDDD